jgi:hypothetical protein
VLIWGAALKIVAQSPCIAADCERLSFFDAVTAKGLYLIAILLCIGFRGVIPTHFYHQAKIDRKPDK